ncbi:MAG: hypothetical protein E6873_12270, partial [Cutibacterium avidum]|nr:hypothetical protein [Cutibacterium avidum]
GATLRPPAQSINLHLDVLLGLGVVHPHNRRAPAPTTSSHYASRDIRTDHRRPICRREEPRGDMP